MCIRDSPQTPRNGEKAGRENRDQFGIEVDQPCGVGALQSVHADAGKLEQHSFLKVEVVDDEIGRALAPDEDMGCLLYTSW